MSIVLPLRHFHIVANTNRRTCRYLLTHGSQMAVVYHGVWLITMLLASPAVVSQDQLGRGVKFLSWIWVWLVKVARNSLLETKLDFRTAKIASLKSGQIVIPQPTVYSFVSLRTLCQTI